jgi:hypothetical protein
MASVRARIRVEIEVVVGPAKVLFVPVAENEKDSA